MRRVQSAFEKKSSCPSGTPRRLDNFRRSRSDAEKPKKDSSPLKAFLTKNRERLHKKESHRTPLSFLRSKRNMGKQTAQPSTPVSDNATVSSGSGRDSTQSDSPESTSATIPHVQRDCYKIHVVMEHKANDKPESSTDTDDNGLEVSLEEFKRTISSRGLVHAIKSKVNQRFTRSTSMPNRNSQQTRGRNVTRRVSNKVSSILHNRMGSPVSLGKREKSVLIEEATDPAIPVVNRVSWSFKDVAQGEYKDFETENVLMVSFSGTKTDVKKWVESPASNQNQDLLLPRQKNLSWFSVNPGVSFDSGGNSPIKENLLQKGDGRKLAYASEKSGWSLESMGQTLLEGTMYLLSCSPVDDTSSAGPRPVLDDLVAAAAYEMTTMLGGSSGETSSRPNEVAVDGPHPRVLPSMSSATFDSERHSQQDNFSYPRQLKGKKRQNKAIRKNADRKKKGKRKPKKESIHVASNESFDRPYDEISMLVTTPPRNINLSPSDESLSTIQESLQSGYIRI